MKGFWKDCNLDSENDPTPTATSRHLEAANLELRPVQYNAGWGRKTALQDLLTARATMQEPKASS